jgi:hypothetical protein
MNTFLSLASQLLRITLYPIIAVLARAYASTIEQFVIYVTLAMYFPMQSFKAIIPFMFAFVASFALAHLIMSPPLFITLAFSVAVVAAFFNPLLSLVRKQIQFCQRQSRWIRDLTQEGIEPNPGFSAPNRLSKPLLISSESWMTSLITVHISRSAYLRSEIKKSSSLDRTQCLNDLLLLENMTHQWIRDLTQEGIEPNPGFASPALTWDRYKERRSSVQSLVTNIVKQQNILNSQLKDALDELMLLDSKMSTFDPSPSADQLPVWLQMKMMSSSVINPFVAPKEQLAPIPQEPETRLHPSKRALENPIPKNRQIITVSPSPLENCDNVLYGRLGKYGSKPDYVQSEHRTTLRFTLAGVANKATIYVNTYQTNTPEVRKYLASLAITFLDLYFVGMQLLLSGDIELNPGPTEYIAQADTRNRRRYQADPSSDKPDTRILNKYRQIIQHDSKGHFTGNLWKDLASLDNLFHMNGYLSSPIRMIALPLLHDAMRRYVNGYGLLDLPFLIRVNHEHINSLFEKKEEDKTVNVLPLHTVPLEHITSQPSPGVKIRKFLVKVYPRYKQNQLSALIKDMYTHTAQMFTLTKTITDQAIAGAKESVASQLQSLVESIKQQCTSAYNSVMSATTYPIALLVPFTISFFVGAFGYAFVRKVWPYVFPNGNSPDVHAEPEAVAQSLFFETGKQTFAQWLSSIGMSIKDGFYASLEKDWAKETIKLGNLTKAIENITLFFQKIVDILQWIIDKSWTWITGNAFFDSTKRTREWIQKVFTLILNIKTRPAQSMSYDEQKSFVDSYASLTLQLPLIKQADRELAAQVLTALGSGQSLFSELQALVKYDCDRQRPIEFWIEGRPGTGKTEFLKLLYPALFEYLRLRFPEAWKDIGQAKFNKTMVYSRKNDQDFWDRYCSQWVCEHDDVFQALDPMVRSAEALSLIFEHNVATFPLHMASIAAKSTTLFESKIIAITTNLSDDSIANVGLTEPQALLRRRDFVISLSLRPVEFFVPCSPGTLRSLDNYHFVVYTTHPTTYAMTKVIDEPGFDGFQKLLALAGEKYNNNYLDYKRQKNDDYSDLYTAVSSSLRQHGPGFMPELRINHTPQPMRFSIDGTPIMQEDTDSEEDLPYTRSDPSEKELGDDDDAIAQMFMIRKASDYFTGMNVPHLAARAMYNKSGFDTYVEMEKAIGLSKHYTALDASQKFPLFQDPRFHNGVFQRTGVVMWDPLFRVYRPLVKHDLEFSPGKIHVPVVSQMYASLASNDKKYIGLTDNRYWQDPTAKKALKEAGFIFFDDIKLTMNPQQVASTQSHLTAIQFHMDLENEDLYRNLKGKATSTLQKAIASIAAVIGGLAVGTFLMVAIFKIFEATGTADANRIEEYCAQSSSKYTTRIQRLHNRKRPTIQLQALEEEPDAIAQQSDDVATAISIRIWKNMRFAEFVSNDGTSHMSWAVGIKDNAYVTTLHSTKPPAGLSHIVLHDCASGNWSSETVYWDKAKKHPMPDRDIILFNNKNSHKVKDLTRLLRSKNDPILDGAPGVHRVDSLLLPDDSETIQIEKSTNRIQAIGPRPIKLMSKDGSEMLQRYMIDAYKVYGVNCTGGDCGQLYVAFNNSVQKKIVGVHVAGLEDGAIVSPLFVEDIDDLVKKLNEDEAIAQYLHFEELPIPSYPGITINENVTGRRWGMTQEAELSHSFSYPRVSNLKASPLVHGLTTPNGPLSPPYECTNLPAKLDAKAEELSMRGLRKRNHHYQHLKQSSFAGLEPDMASLTGKHLTLAEALRGVHHWLSTKAVERNSSGCYPYQKDRLRKCDLILISQAEFDSRKDKPRFVLIDEELWLDKHVHESVVYMYDQAHLGKIVPNMTLFCLKDETRSIQKVKNHHTRAFQMGSITHLIVMRMIYGQFFELLHSGRNGDSQVGINPYSSDWKALYLSMKACSNKIHMADTEAWDLHYPVSSFTPNFHTWYTNMCGFVKHSPLWNASYSILYSSLHPKVVVANKVYSFTGMPSGLYGTAEFNSCANSATNREVFDALVDDHSYDELIIQKDYGDDLTEGLPDSTLEKFNGITISQKMKEMFNMTQTSIDKGPVHKYDPLEDMIFLQRTFVEKDGLVLAPLNEDSLTSMVQWIQKPKDPTVTFNTQFKIVCHQALREWALHPREKFEKHKRILNAFLRELNPGYQFIDTYEQLQMKIVHDATE